MARHPAQLRQKTRRIIHMGQLADADDAVEFPVAIRQLHKIAGFKAAGAGLHLPPDPMNGFRGASQNRQVMAATDQVVGVLSMPAPYIQHRVAGLFVQQTHQHTVLNAQLPCTDGAAKPQRIAVRGRHHIRTRAPGRHRGSNQQGQVLEAPDDMAVQPGPEFPMDKGPARNVGTNPV